MVTLHLVFILGILQSNLVLSMKLLQDSSDKHVKENHNLSHRLFKRQVPCKEGEYSTGEICCKFCHKGTHAASDCTEPHGQPVCEECTEGVDFMDKENGYPKCQKCQNCESGAGKEVKDPCTITQNTVCKCKKGFFDSKEKCNPCQSCDNGIDEECTSTNDTVCTNSSGRIHAIVWPVLAVVFGAIITFFVLRKWRSKRGRTELPNKSLLPLTPTCPSHLENIELDSRLFEIARLMGQESVQKLVAIHLSRVDREDIKRNNPSNAREEKYQLLEKWYNAHGRQGAFKMLIENCTKLEAEKIIDLVPNQNAEP
ncbi:tumor necrosis factor receptor superfamily member 6 [Rana temporaria]|uniref:tumor necrosis factor receptor superfamily member 6 n=1 Tax=Rana temporaria TaxID=8407 RepID=UPI001AACE9E9|nr:tumor necrosis factor receptor superfamily member 6 [Rana temporaria]